MSQDIEKLHAKTGRLIGEDGLIYNYIDLLRSLGATASPVTSKKVDINALHPQTGRIIAENNEVYNEVELLKSINIDNPDYMLKSIYDFNDSGIVDNSERLGGLLPEEFAKKEDIVDFDENLLKHELNTDIHTSTTEKVRWNNSISKELQYPINNDWNNALTTGFYRAVNALNAPDSGWYYGLVEADSENWVIQTLKSYVNNREFERRKENGVWLPMIETTLGVGIETPQGAQQKANNAESNAKMYADINKVAKNSYPVVSGQYSVIGATNGGKEVRRYYFTGLTPTNTITLLTGVEQIINNGIVVNRSDQTAQWHSINNIPPDGNHISAVFVMQNSLNMFIGTNAPTWRNCLYKGYVEVVMA